MNSFLNALGDTHIYPLTDRQVSALSHAEQVAKLSDCGARIIQLREKKLSAREFFIEADAAMRIARKRGTKIIINDRVDIALALGADGVHLGQDDLSTETARRILGPQAIIGISTHTLEQAIEASQMPVDYVAIGPIFPTHTKESHETAVGAEGLRALRAQIANIPLVAIGGITEQSARELLLAGANAVAVISDLWPTQSDPTSKIRRFLTLR